MVDKLSKPEDFNFFIVKYLLVQGRIYVSAATRQQTFLPPPPLLKQYIDKNQCLIWGGVVGKDVSNAEEKI